MTDVKYQTVQELVAAIDSMQEERDAAIARAEAAERRCAWDAKAREWSLGVQVAAQAQRLRLATEAIEALRAFDHGRTDKALAAWDTVSGDAAPVDLG